MLHFLVQVPISVLICFLKLLYMQAQDPPPMRKTVTKSYSTVKKSHPTPSSNVDDDKAAPHSDVMTTHKPLVQPPSMEEILRANRQVNTTYHNIWLGQTVLHWLSVSLPSIASHVKSVYQLYKVLLLLRVRNLCITDLHHQKMLKLMIKMIMTKMI